MYYLWLQRSGVCYSMGYRTEERKTKERKTEERKTEECKTEERKTEQRKTEERKKEEPPVRAVLYCTHVQDRNTRKEDRWLKYCGGGRGGNPPFPLKRSPAHRWLVILLFIPSPFLLHGGFSLECLKADYRAYSSIETYCVIRNPLRLYWKSRLV